MRQVMIVEDDKTIQALVKRCLEEVGLSVTMVGTVAAATAELQKSKYDISIVDLGLPDGDGLMLARKIADNPLMGVIILTGRVDPMDKIIGLEIGADDYVTKPFEPRELAARCKSVIRRIDAVQKAAQEKAEAGQNKATFDGWTVDLHTTQLLSPDGEATDISVSEFEILQVFIEHPNRVLSRDQLMDLVHGNDTPAFDRSIDVRVSRLRSKIEVNPKRPEKILTARNRGYRFTPDVNWL